MQHQQRHSHAPQNLQDLMHLASVARVRRPFLLPLIQPLRPQCLLNGTQLNTEAVTRWKLGPQTTEHNH